jgi:hypothetical protein
MTDAETQPQRHEPTASRGGHAALPALIGLAGVLIGAVTTAGVTYLGDRAHRMADKRTAKRLVANEIRLDTQRLVVVSVLGRLPGARPRTVQWESQAPTLARYVTGGEWSRMSAFYDDLLNLQESLSKQCVTSGTRRLATTVATRGNRAYEALVGESVPSITELGNESRCRPRARPAASR